MGKMTREEKIERLVQAHGEENRGRYERYSDRALDYYVRALDGGTDPTLADRMAPAAPVRLVKDADGA